jgi:hypothetical protein
MKHVVGDFAFDQIERLSLAELEEHFVEKPLLPDDPRVMELANRQSDRTSPVLAAKAIHQVGAARVLLAACNAMAEPLGPEMVSRLVSIIRLAMHEATLAGVIFEELHWRPREADYWRGRDQVERNRANASRGGTARKQGSDALHQIWRDLATKLKREHPEWKAEAVAQEIALRAEGNRRARRTILDVIRPVVSTLGAGQKLIE